MAKIDINIDRVANINMRLPRYMTVLEGIKRELEILKWQLNSDIMNKNDMLQKYRMILNQLSEVEDKISNINSCITSAIYKYGRQEKINESHVDRFL